MEDEVEFLTRLNNQISDRINSFAAIEAQSVLVNGSAAQGALAGAKAHLIELSDRIVNRLDELNA